MKFLNITLATFLAIFLVSCDGSAKDNFSPQGTVWESQPKDAGTGTLKKYRQQKVEFKTADTLTYSQIIQPNCGGTGANKYSTVVEIKYTYDKDKKEVKLADNMKAFSIDDGMGGCTIANPPKTGPVSTFFETKYMTIKIDKNTTKFELLSKTLSDGSNPEDEKFLLKK